jgi:hypothetical protein
MVLGIEGSKVLGSRVLGSGFWVQGSGFRVQRFGASPPTPHVGFKVQRFRVQRFRVQRFIKKASILQP